MYTALTSNPENQERKSLVGEKEPYYDGKIDLRMKCKIAETVLGPNIT